MIRESWENRIHVIQEVDLSQELLIVGNVLEVMIFPKVRIQADSREAPRLVGDRANNMLGWVA